VKSKSGLGATRRSDRKLRVLKMFLNISEELFRVGAVNDAMIEAEREVRQVANGDVIFAIGRSENSGPFFDLNHTWLLYTSPSPPDAQESRMAT
jgi:hypothetical protein